MQQAFDEHKKKLTSSITLMSSDTEQQFTLQMDASGTGIRTFLHQYTDQNIEKIVAFYSRKLLMRKTAYSTIKFECLVVVTAIQELGVCLTGMLFVVVVDYKCLQYLHKVRDESSRLTRWALTLQPFDYKI